MNTLKATNGNWLFNGECFAKQVSGFGDLSKWEEVTEDFKTKWEAEHLVELPAEELAKFKEVRAAAKKAVDELLAREK